MKLRFVAILPFLPSSTLKRHTPTQTKKIERNSIFHTTHSLHSLTHIQSTRTHLPTWLSALLWSSRRCARMSLAAMDWCTKQPAVVVALVIVSVLLDVHLQRDRRGAKRGTFFLRTLNVQDCGLWCWQRAWVCHTVANRSRTTPENRVRRRETALYSPSNSPKAASTGCRASTGGKSHSVQHLLVSVGHTFHKYFCAKKKAQAGHLEATAVQGRTVPARQGSSTRTWQKQPAVKQGQPSPKGHVGDRVSSKRWAPWPLGGPGVPFPC